MSVTGAAMGEKSTPPRPLVVLEEAAITALAVNPKAAAEFPVLGAVKTAARAGGCGRCGAAARARARVFQDVKQALAGMDASRKRRLKELLNAAKVRLVFRTAGGRVQTLTF